MRISDWSSDVCSSDLGVLNSSTRSSAGQRSVSETDIRVAATAMRLAASTMVSAVPSRRDRRPVLWRSASSAAALVASRSEEHTSELQSLMRISYAVFCLKKKRYSSVLNYTNIVGPRITTTTLQAYH